MFIKLLIIRTGDKETRKLAKCTLDGKTYREGELMYPLSSSCYSCICTNTFDKSIPPESNKDCRLIDCEMEIHYFHELRKGCVPVYYSSSSCCPIRFRCRKLNTLYLFFVKTVIRFIPKQMKMMK